MMDVDNLSEEPKSQYVDDEAAEGSDDENADEMEVDRDEAENNELDEDETARGSWSESDTMSDTPVPAGKRAKYKFRSIAEIDPDGTAIASEIEDKNEKGQADDRLTLDDVVNAMEIGEKQAAEKQKENKQAEQLANSMDTETAKGSATAQVVTQVPANADANVAKQSEKPASQKKGKKGKGKGVKRVRISTPDDDIKNQAEKEDDVPIAKRLRTRRSMTVTNEQDKMLESLANKRAEKQKSGTEHTAKDSLSAIDVDASAHDGKDVKSTPDTSIKQAKKLSDSATKTWKCPGCKTINSDTLYCRKCGDPDEAAGDLETSSGSGSLNTTGKKTTKPQLDALTIAQLTKNKKEIEKLLANAKPHNEILPGGPKQPPLSGSLELKKPLQPGKQTKLSDFQAKVPPSSTSSSSSQTSTNSSTHNEVTFAQAEALKHNWGANVRVQPVSAATAFTRDVCCAMIESPNGFGGSMQKQCGKPIVRYTPQAECSMGHVGCVVQMPSIVNFKAYDAKQTGEKTLYDFVYADQELANQELGPKLLELWDRLTAKDQPDVVAAATEEANQHFLALTEFPAVMTIGRPQSGEIRRYLRARKK